MAGVSTSVVQVQAPLNKLTADIQKGRLSWNDYRRSLRSANAIIAENNAIMKAKAVAFKTATGSAKVHMTVIRGTAASYATLGQQIRFAVTATRAFGKQMIATGKNIQWAGRQVMVGLTLPIVALTFATSKLAEEYNKQMTRIVKVTNLTRVRMEDEFGKMQEIYQAGITDPKVMRLAIESIERQSASLLNLGASMGFAAAETSKMAAEFSQMGFAGVALDGLTESALRLARVSGAELPDAMNLTRLAAMAFGKTLGEGPDSLIETFGRLNLIENQTSLSLAEMAGAIPIVAGVAKNLGIDIDKLGGMLALMKDKGIEAREGATSLRTGLIRLVQDATDPAIRAFDRLGISIVELQEKHQGSVFGLVNELAGMLHELQNATEGARQKTDQFIAAIGKMVGTRAAARFTSMLEGIGKDVEQFTIIVEGQEVVQYRLAEGLDQTSDAFRALGPALNETNRALLQFRYEEERVNESLAGQAEIIRARLNVALVRLGERLLPLRNKIMDFVTTMVERFNALSETTRTVVASIVGIFTVLGPLTMLFGVFANAIGQILVLFTRLFPTFKFTTMAMAAEKAAFASNTAAVNSAAAAKMAMVNTNNALVASTNAVTASLVGQNAALAGTFGGAAAAGGAGRMIRGVGQRGRSGDWSISRGAITGGERQRSQAIGRQYGSRRGDDPSTQLRTQGPVEGSSVGQMLLTPAIIASTVLAQMRSSGQASGTLSSYQAMRAGLSGDRIMSFLPRADEGMMKHRTPGHASLLERTRQHLAVNAAAEWERQGRKGSQERFLRNYLNPYRVEQAVISGSLGPVSPHDPHTGKPIKPVPGTTPAPMAGLPMTGREAAGMPQRMNARDVVHLSKAQRAALAAQYGGMRLGGRVTISEIERAARASGAKASLVRSQVERMVGEGAARATYANVSDRQLIAQDRGIAQRQAVHSASTGQLGQFEDNRQGRAARAQAISTERERLLRETRPHAARPSRSGALGTLEQRMAMAGTRFDQSRDVFRGKAAPTTDFQKGLAAGRNAAITALMLFPKLLMSPFKLLKASTIGLVKNFFGLKLAIQAITKGTAAMSAFRNMLKTSPAVSGLRAGARTMGAAGRAAAGSSIARTRAFGGSIAESTRRGMRTAGAALTGASGPRLARIMGQDWVRARRGIGAPTTMRGILERSRDRFRGGTAGSATTDRLVRLRRAHHRQSPLPGMLGFRGGRGAGNVLENMGRVYRRASEAVASFTAAAITARGRLLTSLAAIPAGVRGRISSAGQRMSSARGRARDMLASARRNIRTLPLLATATGIGMRRQASRIRSGQAFRESRLGRRMQSVGIPTTVRGMAGRARDTLLRRPTAGRMETNQMRRLRGALGGHLGRPSRTQQALENQMSRLRGAFATMSASVSRATAALNVMQARLVAAAKSIALSAASMAKSMALSAVGAVRNIPSQARGLMQRAGEAFRRTPLARERAAVGRPNTARGVLGRARDRLLMRPTAGRMQTRQMQRLQSALGGPAGPGFMARRRQNVSDLGAAASRTFSRAVTATAERLRAIQAAAATAVTSLRTFAASVATSSKAALLAAVSFTKAKALALGQAVMRGGGRLLGAARAGAGAVGSAVSGGRAAASAAAAGPLGLLRRGAGSARDQVRQGFQARGGQRRGLSRAWAPVDRFMSGYDRSMATQGLRARQAGRITGPVTPMPGVGRLGTMGRMSAGAGGRARAAGRGVAALGAAGAKFAAGAFTGAGLVFTIPLLISFGAAAAANPEEFKKKMMEIFRGPLEALKNTWDDATAAIRRLFVALRTGGDNDGSKFLDFAAKATGMIGTVLAAAFQFILGIVTTFIEILHGLFALMQGDGAQASDIFGRAFLRLRVVIAEVIASILEFLSNIPILGTIFGPALDAASTALRNWANDTREELAEADLIPNLLADIYMMEREVEKATKKTNDERQEARQIIDDLVRYQILEKEIVDDLKNSITSASLLEQARLESAEDMVWTVRDEAIARENAVDAGLNQIAGMEMLTDEQKAQLAFTVLNAELQERINEREAAARDLGIKLQQLQNGEVENINLERERSLALLYLEAQAVQAAADGDTARAAEIRQRMYEVNNAHDDRKAAAAILATFDERATKDAEDRLALMQRANKEMANRIQLNAREQAQYDALKEELDEQLEKVREWLQAFRSAMGEVMGDIGSAVSRVVDKQIDAIKKLFSEIEDITKDYFSNFSEEFKKTIDELRDAITEQAEEEERLINEIADLAIQKIEDERELEAKLERERQRYFAREKARIDFLAGRRAGTIQVEEAFARGEVGQAAILQIRMQADAQQYYVDQLQENESRLMELREEARENEIIRINDEREAALDLVRLRQEIADAELDSAENVVMTEMDLARAAAEERVNQANEAIDKIIEREGFLRSEFLREWNRITPATEAEYRAHLRRLEEFMNESDARMVAETNRIKDQMAQDLEEISQQFGLTVSDVMTDLELAIDKSGFAIDEFSNDLLRTTANTLMSVLTAFDGFNNGLQQGYANAAALASAFLEMFQREITQAVSWASTLADIMIGEEQKWRDAGEAAGENFRREFEKAVEQIYENASRRLAAISSEFNRSVTNSVDAIAGVLTPGMMSWWERDFGAGAGFGPSGPVPPIVRPEPPSVPSRGIFGTQFAVSGPEAPRAGVAAANNRIFTGFLDPARAQERAWYNPNHAIAGSTRTIISLSDMIGLSAFLGGRLATTNTFGDIDRSGGLGPEAFNYAGIDYAAITYHSGGLVGSSLKSDEVPAVLQKGEYVIQKRAVSAAGVDFLNSLNSSSAMFSVPQIRNLNVEPPGTQSTVNSTNTYNLSFQVDGGTIDEQKLAQKVVFEIKKMERAGGGGRRI